MPDIRGKTIWLVGASTGIGEALAHRLAAAGARLALSARDSGKLAVMLSALPGQGHIALPLDVAQPDSVQQAWSSLHSQWGGIDTMIYNAGIYDPMNAAGFNLAKTQQMIDVNFMGALRVLGCVIPPFVARETGHIVLVASVAAYSGLPNAIGYGASKAALLHLGENLRIDLGKCGITVQVVSPGFVKTRMTDKNNFPMPCIVSPGYAATCIERGMRTGQFEIHFPKRFTLALKFLRLLPYSLYFRIAGRI